MSTQFKDWKHASKLYVANHYELAPKYTFLYHVFFDLTEGKGSQQVELGMMVKQVGLPKFTIDTKTLNAYNRPHIIQTKINYDPVTIQFHDDSADRVRDFWNDYYKYYYRTSDHGSSDDLSQMGRVHEEINNVRGINGWGYAARDKAPYLKAIRIYSLHDKNFSEYTLVNPIIKSFQHGEHNAASGGEVMQHTMNVEYETVFYKSGSVSSSIHGFAELHYDKEDSPSITENYASQVNDIRQKPANGIFGNSVPNDGSMPGSSGAAPSPFGLNLNSMLKNVATTGLKAVLTNSSNPWGSIKLPVIAELNKVGGNILTSLSGGLITPRLTGSTSITQAISNIKSTLPSNILGKVTSSKQFNDLFSGKPRDNTVTNVNVEPGQGSDTHP
jgi:hypothetical protein